MDKYKTINRLDECDEKEIKELLIGRKVKVERDNLILDNGIILEVIANEGCGGFAFGSSIDFYLDCKELFSEENKKVTAQELFETREEAQREADRLNNKKDNIKRATEWNSYENKKRILEMRGF